MSLTFQALPLYKASCRAIKQCAAVTQTEQIQYKKELKTFFGLIYGKIML